MIFYLIGVNFKDVPYHIQERVSGDKKQIAEFWETDVSRHAAVLSTCNRLEVYAVARDVREYLEAVLLFKSRFGYLFDKVNIKAGEREVFSHAVRLAAGLDSQLKGERQILEQVKAWAGRGSFPALLGEIWRQTVPIAEDIRKESRLDNEEYNIASVVYDDLLRNIRDARLLRVVVVGTGRVAELIAEYKPGGIGLYFAAHKNYKRAEQLARRSGGNALHLRDVQNRILHADALISATSSPHRIFNRDYLAEILAKRTRPLYVYDLAMPCDIEPEAGKLDGVVLRNLNNSDELFERHAAGISDNIKLAEYLVEEAVKNRKEELSGYDLKDWDAAEQIGYQAG